MEGKISHSGLLARSPEGHAARGMQIKGNEDVWVEIQANTFRNWVNENLPSNLRVADLCQDLCSGVRLCTLVEKLQGHPIKPSWNKRPMNQHHYLENVACALNAIEQDGVKLVNIGNVDIVNGNLKLILGLIWSLIVRYQIGRSKFPPRKLMLAWLQAVLPECKVNNLTTDWNSGILLSALVDYCRPGLFPHWRKLDKHDGIDNCRRAMSIANKELGIPAVLEPEYLASPWLDELSGMTYLSYFMKPGSPGFHATLRWVNSRLERPVENFTSAWNDGRVISEVIRSLGGSSAAPEKLRTEPSHWESNLTQAVEAGKRLGVHPILSARDMADINVEHLGVMAYAANFQWIPERPPIHDLINVKLESTSGRVGESTQYQVTLMDSSLAYDRLSVEIRGPDNKVYPQRSLKHGRGSFVPQKMGMHEILVYYEGQEVSSKHYFRALPPLVEVLPPDMAPCALGSLVQVLVNATGAPKREDILVTAYSPMGRPLACPLTIVDGTNSATFKPDEAGEWRIEITYQGKQIQGGPFTCAVFDPNGVVVSGLEGALPMVPHAIDLDCRDVCVPGEVYADVVHDKKSLHTRMEKVDADGYLHRVHFTPVLPGKHRVYVYFNGYDVKGSPFMMRVGTQRRSKTSSSPTYRQSPISRNLSASPITTVQAANLNSSITNKNYRQNASPSFATETHKLSQDYHRLSERRLSASSPVDNSPHYIPRASSPSLAPRTQSPTFRPTSPYFRPLSPRPQSPSYITSKKLNTRTDSPNSSFVRKEQEYSHKSRYETSSPSLYAKTAYASSPSFHRKDDYESSYTTKSHFETSKKQDDFSNKMQSIRLQDSRSPAMGSHFESSKKHDDFSNKMQSIRLQESRSPAMGSHFESSKKQDDFSNKIQSIRLQESRSPAMGSHFESSKKQDDFSNKMQSIRLQESRSPAMDRRSPDVNYSTSKYNRSIVESRSYNSSFDSVDTSPVIKINDRSTTRRDSWDALKKTSNILSERSLESLANLNESQLDTQRVHKLQTYNQNESQLDSQRVHKSQSYTQKVDNYGFRSLGKGGASAVKVQPVPDGTLGQPVEFEIDGSGAGSGDLEILVEGGKVTSSVRSLGGQRFKAAFTPHQALPHRVDIRFNGETVPGSPWHVNIMSTSNLSVLGESTRLVPANTAAVFEIITSGNTAPDDLSVHVISPSKRAVQARVLPGNRSGVQSVEFVPTEVGTHIVEVHVNGEKLPSGPLIAKVYDAGLIQVADVSGGVVGQPVQFRVDASQAGEGQLEISINEGEVPNHVQVVGGGRCLVSFTPDHAKPHLIDIKFNGETVRGCPFVCSVTDTSRVILSLSHLELIPVNQPSSFHMGVAGGGAAELAVAVRGPIGELPVKVTGDIHSGFTAEFTPNQVGAHQINVDYNGRPVQGTPFIAKAFDSTRVTVGHVARGTVGRPVTFSVDASEAGEGNLEITISARGLNIPTQVHPQGNAKFAVSFVPAEACDHVVNVAFNKRPVVGCPLIVGVGGGGAGPSVTLPGPGPVHRPSTLLINHPGRLEDIEVNVEGHRRLLY
ncbi:PREDICTED: filamin-A-like isoform X1 [Nicrophorus vespilloides]|uniref:Filamin-A-like isoform X1 n=2 Tax=Nicrophorus vespilloides TaxID=110193 RepID=A0ABM1NAE1_NICVS|nr:PREDICTED: filamin-A-like isoform X1 [Nicrophorus vespilloides]